MTHHISLKKVTRPKKSLKIIFLDIDGVICTDRSQVGMHRKHGTCVAYNWDPCAVAMIQELCDITGAKLVISSSWRHMWRSFSSCAQYLVSAGFKYSSLFFPDQEDFDNGLDFKTPAKMSSTREMEIDLWLNEDYIKKRYPYFQWVAIDDSCNFVNQDKQKHVVTTEPRNGFMIEDYNKALNILNGNY